MILFMIKLIECEYLRYYPYARGPYTWKCTGEQGSREPRNQGSNSEVVYLM